MSRVRLLFDHTCEEGNRWRSQDGAQVVPVRAVRSIQEDAELQNIGRQERTLDERETGSLQLAESLALEAPVPRRDRESPGAA